MTNNEIKKNVGSQKPATIKPVTIGNDVLIKVKSVFIGKLIYKNLTTQETTIWERPGEIQLMTMSDLRAMKSQQVAFFANQWVMILGVADGEICKATAADIYKALVITKYYENFIDPSNFDIICDWKENEIPEKISLLSSGAKENLIVALNEFIKSGKLDSIRKIKAFEKALDCELTEFK